MRSIQNHLALAAAISTAKAAFQGFNYGNTFTTGQIKTQADFEAEFEAAQSLAGTNGAFNSARLYTTVQGNSANEPIEAIPAAINTKTSLLLGLWASAGEATFNNELAALQKAIDTYGANLAGLVAGISVGSEDLYRNSPTGIAAGEYAGANPDTLVQYITSVRELIAGTPLEGAKIGHVDTWTAYVNGSNQAVIDACDWLGMDAYPYFEDTHPNGVENGAALFADALGATQGAGSGKEVWITETGWPVSGKTVGAGVPSPENAETYWKDVGCPMFGTTNVWWYTLQDALPDTPNPSFGVISDLNTAPLYDLSCSSSSTNGSVVTTTSVAPGVPSSVPSSPGGGGDGGRQTNGTNPGIPSGSGSGGSNAGSGSGSISSPDSSFNSTTGPGSNSTTGSGSGSDGQPFSGSSGPIVPRMFDSIAASVIALIGAMALL
jgi:glucan endo-1,3-beta-D-glucosidase